VKTILITGGAGFIGSNFVRRLYVKYPDYRIVVLDVLTYAGFIENLPCNINEVNDSRLKFWYGDVLNAGLVNRLVSECNAVVHFAAETHVTRSIFDNLRFFQTDVLGTQVVANAVLNHASRIERFIHISSSEVYGTALSEFIDEDHLLMPMSPYAAAKAGADRLVYSYWATYGLPIIILRPFNNYGPYQHLEKVIPRFITGCILGEELKIHGDGSAARDWVYVEDCCEAIDLALHCDMDKVKGQAINIGTGRSISIGEIADRITGRMCENTGCAVTIEDRPGQVVRHTAAIRKAEQLLGWKPNEIFETGLDKTIRWYRENRAWWEKQLWMRSVPIVTVEGKMIFH
jgi:dTDP-glucose 4,6-dehydratase